MINGNIGHRRSIRLPDFDYTQEGAYFLTICTQGKICRFGHIEDAQMIVNQLGLCAQSCWYQLPKHFPKIVLDEFIVMPNHIHGILFFQECHTDLTCSGVTRSLSVGAQHAAPSAGKARVIQGSLGAVVRSYKSVVTKLVHQFPWHHDIALWQRNYYEHVIRGESDLYIKRNYIQNNPLEWELDEFYVVPN